VKPAEIPGFARVAGPVRPGVVVVQLDEPDTASLVARARQEGASVHGAIGAAELIAMRGRFGVGDAPTLTLTSPVDLRSELSAPMDDATPGFYVTLLSSSHAVSGAQDFWPLAHTATDLRRQLAEGCGHLFYHLVPPTETLAPAEVVIAGFRAYIQRMPEACMLSNVGRVASRPELNGVHIDNVSFALCPMAHQPVFVAASTWGARLTLNIVHDTGRFSGEACQAAAQAMQALLSA
jgi:hypothetical protein